ncbi:MULTISPECIES: NAD(P)H-dependent glycerol-3-phosphate dehydrogenase [Marinobacterium]|jgi:glycerol-3-phosphate dehydrogenase (NAD(P)+)|uniref:Glycerol-3-phosphate dehydrogenase [NAD(P)+] n=1 Tax=Marinobacterium iners DSM 11526 TaxID=1122198 RepID=A0A1H3ZMB9_9GAMM|nr:NAD(P)H-dependent glycerol-3-phosphate dehydrogenase [Marinobacterium iners]QSR35418.1 glycerol-3-phosphate dehydrogenase [Marinobacterium iners]SEA24797.1 glycerol 3-phosphate dehydrogenase (NAD(P)+) [Marinobacterium iners DSM 11526]
MQNQSPVAVLGGGSFGTVLANLMAEKGLDVRLWMRNEQAVDEVNAHHRNSRYLPGVDLAPGLRATTDLQEALSGTEAIFIAIPSSAFRTVVRQAVPFLRPEQLLVSTTKGVESVTFCLMSQIIEQEFPGARVGVLSGPNLAKEVARKQLTATVIASTDGLLRERVQALLHTSFFRVYASTDTYGVELGGTLKNIYAIAAGLSAALGMGENTKSMLMTRSLAEMSRFAVSLGANPFTFLGLAGVGDLIVTCMSPLSRNYRVGYALGEGKSLEQAVESLGEVAEGVNTLRIVKEKAEELEIYMPLVSGLYEVVFNAAPVKEVARGMMLNVQSTDVEFVLPRQEQG